jgi:hypothetical protein
MDIGVKPGGAASGSMNVRRLWLGAPHFVVDDLMLVCSNTTAIPGNSGHCRWLTDELGESMDIDLLHEPVVVVEYRFFFRQRTVPGDGLRRSSCPQSCGPSGWQRA